MNKTVMEKIYQDRRYLDYLRNNPAWYKILHYSPNQVDNFINEVKGFYKIRLEDKLATWQNNIGFIQSIIEYIKK